MKKINKNMTLVDKINKGIYLGVAKALAEHKRAGVPIAVWQDGKVVRIPAESIEIPDINK